MIIFDIIYCLVIIAFITIVVYVYKKYKQAIIELIDTIKIIYNILSKFKIANDKIINDKIANDKITNDLIKSINIINKNHSNISKKLSNIKNIVTNNRNNNKVILRLLKNK